MVCPFCNQPMVCGKLYSPSERGIFWVPNGFDIQSIKGWRLKKKNINDVGGIFLDDVASISFIAKDRPNSFYCKSCNLFLTKCE